MNSVTNITIQIAKVLFLSIVYITYASSALYITRKSFYEFYKLGHTKHFIYFNFSVMSETINLFPIHLFLVHEGVSVSKRKHL